MNEKYLLMLIIIIIIWLRTMFTHATIKANAYNMS